VREAVGVQHADPALFSLPAPGRLLVVSAGHGGVWLVHDDGFKRRIGSYDDAQWSPHGRYLVATRGNELLALEPNGAVRWTLARREPLWPRWEGTDVDTRIAYLARSGLRVVAGDGTGDRLLDAHAQDVAPAWDPARLHVVAYVAGRDVVVRNADTGRVLERTPVAVLPSALTWSDDGRLLAVVSPHRVVVLGGRSIAVAGETVDAEFQPGSHALALNERHNGRSRVELVRGNSRRLLFAGPGAFGGLAWSPDGAWLLVTWPTADQWVFLHGARVRAVGNIEEQFPRADHQSPLLELSSRWSR
jgi:Tol biopolymer transport system component